jgi:hypothetical protein
MSANVDEEEGELKLRDQTVLKSTLRCLAYI